MNPREKRKLDHLRLAVEVSDGPKGSGWGDIHFVNLSVPEIDRQEIDTGCDLWGKRLRLPLLINAMTGGTALSGEINRTLAEVARETGVAMAVGSQHAALDNPGVRETYAVARRYNPDGLLLANLSARATPHDAREACNMIEADGLQLHLNVAQELAMAEGDRSFRGLLGNIARVVEEVPVPVVVKEVGFGLSREAAERLSGVGVQWLDTGGCGGTNFISIEQERRGRQCGHLRDWGLASAVSLLEVAGSGCPVKVVATGGIRSALDLARALALGAELGGVVGPFLRILRREPSANLASLIRDWGEELKDIMTMVGCRLVSDLRLVPMVITGGTREWLEQRGFDLRHLARRCK